MTREYLQQLLDSGEGFTIEYKLCKSRLSNSVYETVCSFSNRYGGYLLLGVEEIEKDGRKVGRAIGVNEDAVYDMRRNFINALNNTEKFSPTLYLNLEEFDYDGKKVLWVYVPPTSNVCMCVGRVYDRNDDADQDVTDIPIRVQDLYSRKSTEYFEKKIFPYARKEHLMLELMKDVRKLVKENSVDGKHPWLEMDDMGIMRSAGLYETNIETGQEGFNLAAILLFGKPEVIQSCSPGYKTDAIFRRENMDRYDDRLIVEDNLIIAYEILMQFAKKHMDDRFVLEGDQRIDARVLIAREAISNILIHREYSSAFPAKLIIENDTLHTENWSRSRFKGKLDIAKFEPYPKNPILARFFVNIGRADTLGSGMRNLYKYTKLYSGGEPELREGDVFTIDVPLYMKAKSDNNEVSQDSLEAELKTVNAGRSSEEVRDKFGRSSEEVRDKFGRSSEEKWNKIEISSLDLNETLKSIIEKLRDNPHSTARELSKKLGITERSIEKGIKRLKDAGILVRHGANKGGYWEILIKE